MNLKTLWRPVGQTELELIQKTEMTAFPPRLSWQPIFYPVLNQKYATQIAQSWNTKDEFSGYAGYVLEFDLPVDFLDQYDVQNVGGHIHEELWVPANELTRFNAKIEGAIRLVEAWYGEEFKGKKFEF